MDMIGRIRRLHARKNKSEREISRMTGLSRNTIAKWLKAPLDGEPKYRRSEQPGKLTAFHEVLKQALKVDAHRPKHERRTARALYSELKSTGYEGGYSRVTDFIRQWRQGEGQAAATRAFVPLSFELGEAFQFDWSCEYLFIGGLRRRLEVAHTKLAASRAFCLVAYYSQAHEMLFDAHARAFALFGGVPRRGIYDNMKTAVDKVGQGKQRSVNARFEAMTGHYLFEPEFCNRAAGWEKGVVEKNVQDRRKDIWREASERRWGSLDELNDWLEQACVKAWGEMSHPEWGHLTVADVWQDERARLMPNPRAFDGYVEQPVRVSATSLIHFQRNRYSVPCEWIHAVVSLRAYADGLLVVGPDGRQVRLQRSFERDQTLYDWMHYIALIERKPGALRNGAPFKTMPEPLQELQRQLLRHSGGDRVMAQVLMGVSLHGLEAVLVAVELALQSGRVSAEHVLNVLSRLQEQRMPEPPVTTILTLNTPPLANLQRYDALRNAQPHEASPESDHA